MQKDPLIYLEHMLFCIKKIKVYTKGMKEADFLQSTLIQDAVIRNFEIIGEASKNLSGDFRARYPTVEWKKIAGMRDKLIHDYIGWAVWGVVDKLVPTMEKELGGILEIEKRKQ